MFLVIGFLKVVSGEKKTSVCVVVLKVFVFLKHDIVGFLS